MKKIVLITFVAILIGGSLFIWFGVYNIAATDKHWAITTQLLELIRERSIETRLDNIVAPNLNDPDRIASAAKNYDEMCVMCHLAPGIKATELHVGLYPRPPVFHESDHVTHDARANFWVIKNGIKLTGMPAWGKSHKDESIWGLVAFIGKLKDMTAKEYQSITVNSNMKNNRH